MDADGDADAGSGGDTARGAEAAGLLREGVLVEWYRYGPGPAVALPRHAHEEYQLNLNLDLPGGARYRGAYEVQPPRTLAVIMPEEAHTPIDPEGRDRASRHLTLYLPPEQVRDVAGQVTAGGSGVTRPTALPTFADLVVDDAELVGRFCRLHAVLRGASFALDRDVRLLALLADLLDRHADGFRPRRWRGSAGHRAVRRARDHLHDNLAANVSLADLATVSGISHYHLTRLFTASLGMPPHAYQIQLRIDRAKRLLLAGRSISATAHEVGFFDLSHLTRHFKRHVGISPGAYARRAQRSTA